MDTDIFSPKSYDVFFKFFYFYYTMVWIFVLQVPSTGILIVLSLQLESKIWSEIHAVAVAEW